MEKRRINHIITTVIALVLTSTASAQSPSFIGLGDLPGGAPIDFYSTATGISADGRTVVGQSISSNGYEAFRWTAETGIVGLGDLPGRGFFSYAGDVSQNGSVVVGFGESDIGQQGFRWTPTSGIEPIGTVRNEVTAVSDNGSVVVGEMSGQGLDDFEAFRWTLEHGLEGLGDLPGGELASFASGISGDGSIVVGRGTRSRQGLSEAVLWTPDGELVALGNAEGKGSSSASAASYSGHIVVGRSGNEATRWVVGDAPMKLGVLNEISPSSEALAVSGDGSIVVGTSYTGTVADIGYEAFIWEESHGMRRLQTVLEEQYGLPLRGWTLTYAKDISNDGTTIAGSGVNPEGDYEAWVAVIPEPSSAWMLGALLDISIYRRRSGQR
jgi:probable HAF family extracellular repeat protein